MLIKLEVGGGLEAVFGVKKLQLDVENGITMKELLDHLRKNVIKQRLEMFMEGDSVRPGVLVLINDADWELEGTLDYIIQDGDTIVFISTLHGG